VLVFDSSMNPAVKGISLKKTFGGTSVAGTFSFAPGSNHTVLVFQPDQDLEVRKKYQLTLESALTNAQGQAYDPGDASTLIPFETARADLAVTFKVMDTLTVPANEAEKVSDGASILVFFSEAVDITNGSYGLGSDENGLLNDNLVIKDQDNNAIAGTVAFHYDNRLMVFTPDSPLPGGKRIKMKIDKGVKNGDGDESLGADYETSFTIVDFPRVTGIAFPDGPPVVVRPSTIYGGSINLATDTNAFSVDVTLEGSGAAERLTLIFWDNDSRAVINIFEGTFASGTFSFDIDLSPEDLDPFGTEPELAELVFAVGCYTTKANKRSPIGPAFELPEVLRDLKRPTLISLGPPNDTSTAVPNVSFLTEEYDYIFSGRASENLSSVSLGFTLSGAAHAPASGIKFYSVEYPAGSATYKEEVTLGDSHLFITPPFLGETGSIVPEGGKGGSVTRADWDDSAAAVTDVTLTDLVGNVSTYSSTDPNATYPLTGADMNIRGYFYSVRVSAANKLKVRCCDSATLRSLSGADVIVENISQDTTWAGTSGSDGLVSFVTLTPAPSAGDRMMVTIVKNGYQITSYAWSYDTDLDHRYLSLNALLASETSSNVNSAMKVSIENETGDDLDHIFLTGTELVSSDDDRLVDAGANPSQDDLVVRGNKLQVLYALGIETTTVDRYHWAWSDPLISDAIGLDAATDSTMSFVDALDDPMSTSTQIEVLDLGFATVLGSGASRHAWLGTELPGFTGTLVLGSDRTGSLASGLYHFAIPIPPTLFRNEVTAVSASDGTLDEAVIEPAHELIMEPDAGPASLTADFNTVQLDALKSYLFIEVKEVGEGDDPPVIARRVDYFEPGVSQTLVLPAAMAVPSMTGSEARWGNVLKDAEAGADWERGLYTLHYSNPAASRHWICYMSYKATQAAGVAPDTAVFDFPELDPALGGYGGNTSLTGANTYTDFTGIGDYPFYLEAYYIPDFSLSSSFLSEIQRKWKTFWRSSRVSGTK
ncbi:MAG: Ig-like domain-containing protein, partial [Planctomycetota bacterium]